MFNFWLNRNLWFLFHLWKTEPDILRFPISLLTVSALISGITISLLDYYEAEVVLRRQRRLASSDHEGPSSSYCICNHYNDDTDPTCVRKAVHLRETEETQRSQMNRVIKASKCVILDMTDLLNICDVSVPFLIDSARAPLHSFLSVLFSCICVVVGQGQQTTGRGSGVLFMRMVPMSQHILFV